MLWHPRDADLCLLLAYGRVMNSEDLMPQRHSVILRTDGRHDHLSRRNHGKGD
jgi:hypothetical protein